jgi:hypothetical protein
VYAILLMPMPGEKKNERIVKNKAKQWEINYNE